MRFTKKIIAMKKELLFGIMLFMFAIGAKAQTADTINDNIEPELITIVEIAPEFPGGIQALKKFISSNLIYPQEAKEAGIEGRVFVSFIIEKDGSLSSIQLLRGIGYGCDEEAMAVVKKMPKWKPATQRGKPVRMRYQLPFVFKLENENEQ